jgi:hypothetical protein
MTRTSFADARAVGTSLPAVMAALLLVAASAAPATAPASARRAATAAPVVAQAGAALVRATRQGGPLDAYGLVERRQRPRYV